MPSDSRNRFGWRPLMAAGVDFRSQIVPGPVAPPMTAEDGSIRLENG